MKRPVSRRVLGLALGLATVLAAACSASSEETRRPNILVIVVDTLRADLLPFYGHPSAETPFLSALAEQSLVYENATSTSSWTAPAAASLFTGLYPDQHGVLTGHAAYRQSGSIRRLNRIPAEIETLPEILGRLGYRTFGFADNFNVGQRLGFDQGFDHLETLRFSGADKIQKLLEQAAGEIHAAEPWFVYLHYMDPHSPYHMWSPWFEAPETSALALPTGGWPNRFGIHELEWLAAKGDPTVPGRERWRQAWDLGRAAYLSELERLDQLIGMAFETLGVDERTLVVFLADHGEEFGDHGDLGHQPKLYEELVRIPLILRLPGTDAPRGRVLSPVSLIDVLPTLRLQLGLDLLQAEPGVPLPEETEGGERVLFAMRTSEESGTTLRCVQRSPYKAIFLEGPTGIELYDLSEDPAETRNLARMQPGLARELVELWEDFERRAPRFERAFGEPVLQTPEEDQRLRDLGYGGR